MLALAPEPGSSIMIPAFWGMLPRCHAGVTSAVVDGATFAVPGVQQYPIIWVHTMYDELCAVLFWSGQVGFCPCRLWYYYLDPLSYTVYGLVASQLADVTTLIDVPGQGSMSVQSYLIITYRELMPTLRILILTRLMHAAAPIYCCLLNIGPGLVWPVAASAGQL